MEEKKNRIEELAEIVFTNSKNNLNEVNPKYDPTSEIDKFYYGILSRQVHLLADVTCLLRYGFHHYLSGVFIISRTLLDDFMHLHFVHSQPNSDKEIVALNADAHGKNYKKILELADLNETELDGRFPYYPTAQMVQELKAKILADSNKSKYLKDKTLFKFHPFKNKRQIIESYLGEDINPDMVRIYFLWKHLSDYIHFSKFTYDFESEHHEDDTNLSIIEEVIIYSYKASKICMEYFDSKYSTGFNSIKYFEEVEVEYLNKL